MRRLRVVRWNGNPVGCWLVQLVPVGCVAMLIIQVLAARVGEDTARASWRWPSTGGVARARILRNLTASTGEHLVFVRYSPQHDPGDEWVYNEADIDASRVVWARELDRFSNARLMAYFHSRQVWLADPDVSTTIIPYRNAPPRAMFFMPLGTPGIETLRSAEETGLKIQALAGDKLLTCDQWNYYFTEATGVMGPVVTELCYAGNDRAQPISFPAYFHWLQRQR